MYLIKLSMLTVFILMDLALNSMCDHDEMFEDMTKRNTVGVLMFGAQIIVQILVFVVFFLLLCGTFLFRVGILGQLLKNIKAQLAVSVLYFILTGVNGIYRVIFMFKEQSMSDLWDVEGFTVVAALQRFVATVYYYTALRTGLKLGNPMFYQRDVWVKMYQQDPAKLLGK